ncbi:SpoVR family protein [Acinetobacter sp.]|uniref:SpoVR family protein n=1 Tax=Acinetobacter sp. TaxID=472 RepID=UPI00388E5BB2
MTEPLYITSHTDWTPALIEQVWKEIELIAAEEMDLKPGVDIYPNSIEIISAEQMLDAYSSIGLPIHYNHWSFGKDFLKSHRAYQSGRQGLAYEIVINTNPCISYLMEDNNMVMQTMVMAHAAIGHNAVFKNNESFKQWTNAGSIVDYMIFARDYIRQCEERYGEEEVELVLDAAHSLAPHGVDKFKRKHHPRMSEEARLQKLLADEDQKQRELDIIMKKTSFKDVDLSEHDEGDSPEEEENLLYFIMKHSPNLPQWKREILRIVYKVNQYFYPQGQTKNLNEGFASFCHYYIMTRLEEKGFLSPDAFMAFLESHSAVIYQPVYTDRWYSGPNPYALGFAILMDLKRMCENPTDEDREWFPHLMGRRWQEVIKEAAFEHRDDSFVAQYMSPKVIRDLKLFTIGFKHGDGDEDDDTILARVTEIHDEVGYKNIRNSMARSLERINYVPQIVVKEADLEGDRTLRLEYVPYMGRAIDLADADLVTDYIDSLWGYAVEIDC